MTQAAFQFGDCLPTLDAGRVQLRWLTNSDIPALLSVFGDPEVTRYWGFARLPDLAAAALLAEIHKEFRSGNLFQWGVEIPDGQLAGTCTLADIDLANRRAELGFALGRAFWGRGYVAAALPALLKFAFGGLGLHRVFDRHGPPQHPVDPGSGAARLPAGRCSPRTLFSSGRATGRGCVRVATVGVESRGRTKGLSQ